MYKGQYDPDPRARRHRRHHTRKYDPQPRRRRGVPKQLRAWVYHRGHRRTHKRAYDPRPRRHIIHRRRYDPAPRRRSYRRYARGIGNKVEGTFSKYGTWIGGLLALAAGVWTGVNEYAAAQGGDMNKALQVYYNRIVSPEIAHLWTSDKAGTVGGWNPALYLRYKFTGIDQNGNQPGSAWVMPFWIGLVAWIGGTLGKKLLHGKYSRILTPIAKLGKGATIVSAIGALALPGSQPMEAISPSTSNVLTMHQTPSHMYIYKG